MAKKENRKPVEVALAWLLQKKGITAPIIGGRNAKQLKPSLDSVKIEMTEELRSRISELSPEPPPATDRNEEKTEFNYGQR